MRRLAWVTAFVLIMSAVLAGCGIGKKDAGTVVKDLDQVIKKMDSYQGVGRMVLHSGAQPQEYQVEVWYQNPHFYRISLTNEKKDITQIVLRNNEGVFVLTPHLNKSFRFQSDWPENQGQVYLYQSLVSSIVSDKDRQFTTEKDAFVFDVLANYQNNSSLARQKIWLSKKDYAPQLVQVADASSNVMVEVNFSKFEFGKKFEKDSFDTQRNMTGTGMQQQSGDAGKSETDKAGQNQAEPKKADPSKADPSKADPSKADPSKADPSKADPSKADPGRTGPSNTEPGKSDPAQAGPTGKSPAPTAAPSPAASAAPSLAPTTAPSPAASVTPGLAPTAAPSPAASATPGLAPTAAPSQTPNAAPTLSPAATASPDKSGVKPTAVAPDKKGGDKSTGAEQGGANAAVKAGETQSQKSKSFAVIEPAYKPAGVKQQDMNDILLGDEPAVMIRYTGSYHYTLVESHPHDRAVIALPGKALDLGYTLGFLTGEDKKTLFWTYDGVEYRLSSADLPNEEMIKIAQAVQGGVGK